MIQSGCGQLAATGDPADDRGLGMGFLPPRMAIIGMLRSVFPEP
jgi:hypothetical protein